MKLFLLIASNNAMEFKKKQLFVSLSCSVERFVCLDVHFVVIIAHINHVKMFGCEKMASFEPLLKVQNTTNTFTISWFQDKLCLRVSLSFLFFFHTFFAFLFSWTGNAKQFEETK